MKATSIRIAQVNRRLVCLLLTVSCAPDQYVSMGSDRDERGDGGGNGNGACSFGGTSVIDSVPVTAGVGGTSAIVPDTSIGGAGNATSGTNTCALGGAGGTADCTAGTSYHLPWKV